MSANKNDQFTTEQFLLNLSGSELTSFLLNIFSKRSNKISSSHIFNEWKKNKLFALPYEDLKLSRKIDSIFHNNSKVKGFKEIEIPPICPIGTASVLGPVHQNNIFSALRGSEVVSDSTNVMALEAAKLREHALASSDTTFNKIKISTTHRLLRAQKFDEPKALAHFKIFSMVTAGKDTGNSEFELEMAEHILIYVESLKEITSACNIVVTLFIENDFLKKLFLARLKNIPAKLIFNNERPSGNGYYKGLSFNIDVVTDNGLLGLVDGGLTNWTAQLLSNNKEKLIISGAGIARTISII